MKTYLARITENAAARFKTGPLVAIVAILGACLMAGCGTAKVTGARDFTAAPAGKPTVVYVADFDLLAQDIKHEPGILQQRSDSPGPVRRLLPGAPKNPATRARELVDLMSSSLREDLNQAGFSAVRLRPGDSLPADGWFIRGVFTDVQEGNRLRRSLIGFGKGQTDLQVVTGIDNLAQGSPKPLYEIDTDASSSKAPGAAPTIMLGPYGAAARYVMAGQDLERNVKQTASKITAEIVQRVQKMK